MQAHIGSGGFGDVYRVYDEPNPKMVRTESDLYKTIYLEFNRNML